MEKERVFFCNCLRFGFIETIKMYGRENRSYWSHSKGAFITLFALNGIVIVQITTKCKSFHCHLFSQSVSISLYCRMRFTYTNKDEYQI